MTNNFKISVTQKTKKALLFENVRRDILVLRLNPDFGYFSFRVQAQNNSFLLAAAFRCDKFDSDHPNVAANWKNLDRPQIQSAVRRRVVAWFYGAP